MKGHTTRITICYEFELFTEYDIHLGQMIGAPYLHARNISHNSQCIIYMLTILNFIEKFVITVTINIAVSAKTMITDNCNWYKTMLQVLILFGGCLGNGEVD